MSTIHLKVKSITECSDVKPCRHFEYKAKFEKRSPLFRSKIGTFDIYFERLCEEIFEDLEIKSNYKSQTHANIFHKVGIFAKLHKSTLLIATIVKEAVLGLTTESL